MEGLRYYPLAVNLDKCMRSCETLNDLFNRGCVPDKAEDLRLPVSNMITKINKSKILIKHVSYKFKCKFDGRNATQIKSGIMINVGVSENIQKNIRKHY